MSCCPLRMSVGSEVPKAIPFVSPCPISQHLPLIHLIPPLVFYKKKTKLSNRKQDAISFSLPCSPFILPRALGLCFSCCFWEEAFFVSEVKCLCICRVASVQHLLGAGNLVQATWCCHREVYRKRWLASRGREEGQRVVFSCSRRNGIKRSESLETGASEVQMEIFTWSVSCWKEITELPRNEVQIQGWESMSMWKITLIGVTFQETG